MLNMGLFCLESRFKVAIKGKKKENFERCSKTQEQISSRSLPVITQKSNLSNKLYFFKKDSTTVVVNS